MKKQLLAVLSLIIMFSAVKTNAQVEYESPAMISTAIYHDVVGPLKDFPAMTADELAELDLREAKMKRNQDLKVRNYPYWEAPTKPDAGLQSEMGTQDGLMSIIQNWEAQYSYSIQDQTIICRLLTQNILFTIKQVIYWPDRQT